MLLRAQGSKNKDYGSKRCGVRKRKTECKVSNLGSKEKQVRKEGFDQGQIVFVSKGHYAQNSLR